MRIGRMTMIINLMEIVMMVAMVAIVVRKLIATNITTMILTEITMTVTGITMTVTVITKITKLVSITKFTEIITA